MTTLHTKQPLPNIFQSVLEAEGTIKSLEKSIDIYDFFDVICKLFDKLASLHNDTGDQKMRLKVIYPDEKFIDDVTNVTYDIIDRRPLILELKSGAVTQNKARQYPGIKDIVSDQIVANASYQYTNYVKFTVWSPEYKELLRTVKFIESVFLKHKGILKQSVKDIFFVQVTETQFEENNFKQRFYNKSLIYKVDTEEMYKLLYEEIKQITISN